MDEKEIQEFSLEDILKEFGGAGEEAEQEETRQEEAEAEGSQADPEDTKPLPTAEELRAAEVAQSAPGEHTARFVPVRESEEPSEPTVRIPVIKETRQERSAPEETIRLDAIGDTHGTVRDAEPVQEEPYSKSWEPQYEQPMGDYVPPPPIIFRPRSRLRELKRKLVAGPERKYYELSEKGVGKLQLAIFFSLLVVLVGAVSTVMYSMGMIHESRMRLMVFVQFLAMLISALLGSYQMLEGLGALLKGRFTPDTLLFFTFVACCVDGVLCLRQETVPCCAAFSLEVTMSLWGAYQRRNTQLDQLDTMRKAIRLDSVGICPDYSDGQNGYLRGEGQVEDFMDTYDRPTGPDRALGIYSLVAFLLCAATGVMAGYFHGVHFGIRTGAVALLAAMPATVYITVSRPTAVLQRRLHGLGAVFCGWKGIRKLCGKGWFPITHEDLFPLGSIKMNGVKYYSKRDREEILAYAAAMITADGGSLQSIFTQLLESRSGIHYDVENLRGYENGGIGGEIRGEPVLMGTLEFLRQMGVETPEGIRINQAVCIAVDGELCGVFAMTYDKVHNASSGLSALCAYRGLRPILVTNDFMLTPGYIRNKFGVNVKRMHFPEHDLRNTLRQKELEVGSDALLLVTREGLAPFAYGVAGARSLRTATTVGVVLHILGGTVGLGMMALLGWLGAEHLLVPGNLFLYQLLWMIPGLMITEWTRTI